MHYNSRVLPINRKQKVFPNGTLVIENVERMSDEATYTCVAKNSQGYTAKGTLEVQVMGKFVSNKIFKIVVPLRPSLFFHCEPSDSSTRSKESVNYLYVL